MASDPRRANSTKRDRLKRRVWREENVCHLCGQWVDKRLPRYLPGSPTLDELVPISFGGSPFERENVRLCHFWCNRVRGTSPVSMARERLTNPPPRFGADGQRISTELEPVSSRSWLG
ncbi:HNH nuclease [Janibacter hoylei PVAS-1]|uniref:HNH nuclease n=1 Tax=Janibacter hoylei PVAS-1 TaxID=1210046 RepID=K1E9P4_9MICO|nr:HNH nuclease [Janibacter hoylei PVAS-1]